MDLEKKFDEMSQEERDGIEPAFSEWNEMFEKAKASGDDFNVFQMITTTESVYCLWKILQYLKGVAELEASEDSMEHWRGFLAKSNMKLCRTIMRDKGREYGNL